MILSTHVHQTCSQKYATKQEDHTFRRGQTGDERGGGGEQNYASMQIDYLIMFEEILRIEK